MKTHALLWGVVFLAVFFLGALWGRYPVMSSASAQEGTKVVPLGPAQPPNPVVASTVHQTVTENEYDAFDQQIVRRTRMTVSSVVLVHADGTTEVRRVGER